MHVEPVLVSLAVALALEAIAGEEAPGDVAHGLASGVQLRLALFHVSSGRARPGAAALSTSGAT